MSDGDVLRGLQYVISQGFVESHTNGHHTVDAIPEPEAPWPERKPLRERPEVPVMPEWMVPAPFRPRTKDVAERACIPLEMVAVPTMIGAGAVVGRQIGIRPNRNDYYLVVPNLRGGDVARPGWLKTSAIEEAIKPVKSLAAKARDRYQTDVENNSSRQARIKAEIDAIKSEMVSTAKAKGERG